MHDEHSDRRGTGARRREGRETLEDDARRLARRILASSRLFTTRTEETPDYDENVMFGTENADAHHKKHQNSPISPQFKKKLKRIFSRFSMEHTTKITNS